MVHHLYLSSHVARERKVESIFKDLQEGIEVDQDSMELALLQPPPLHMKNRSMNLVLAASTAQTIVAEGAKDNEAESSTYGSKGE